MAYKGINESGVITLVAGVAIAQYQRVKLAASQSGDLAIVDVAGAGEQHIGYADRQAAIGETVPVRLRNASGTRLAIAATGFAAGAVLYGAATGQVDDAVSGNAVGLALEAATATGDIVSILDDNSGLS